MILFRGESQAEQGFRETLRQSAKYEFTFTVMDAQHSTEKLNRIVQGLDAGKYRLIYTFGTMTTQRSMKTIKDTPIIFNIVQRPLDVGIIKSWRGSGNNTTGASNFVSMESAFRTLRTIMHIQPGFLYYPHDPSSRCQKIDVEAQERHFGFRKTRFSYSRQGGDPAGAQGRNRCQGRRRNDPGGRLCHGVRSRYHRHLEQAQNSHDCGHSRNGQKERRSDRFRSRLLFSGAYGCRERPGGAGGEKPGELPIRRGPQHRLDSKTADKMGINFPIQLLMLSEVVR